MHSVGIRSVSPRLSPRFARKAGTRDYIRPLMIIKDLEALKLPVTVMVNQRTTHTLSGGRLTQQGQSWSKSHYLQRDPTALGNVTALGELT